MTLDALNSLELIEVMENYLEVTRPPEEIRHQIDISYKIENQSVILYEVRPMYMDQNRIIDEPYAKATFVHSKNHWKVFWMRADLKWHSYTPKPTVKKLNDFLKLVDEDAYGCFKG